MRTLTLLVASMVLLVGAPLAAQENSREWMAGAYEAGAAQEAVRQQAPAMVAAARQALIEEKAVSRTDKITVDITGVLADSAVFSGDGCDYQPVELLALFLRVKGQWISAFCHPSALNSCLSLRLGQRVRVQGVLIAAPDVLHPDFNPCDQSTWFVGPINFLFATKITK